MKVPLLDLVAQYQTIRDEIKKEVDEVFESQYFILGPKVKDCEKAVAEYSQCKYGVGVSSGSDALLLALMTEGIGEGDEVITTPYTFFATAGSIARLGAKPVFVDIDPVTYNINPALIEEKITDRTKAVMPVHLYGQCADMTEIMAIAEKHNLAVIEDAAQAIGAEYKGKRAGSIGHYGCFSFFPSKNLGGAGDGGMVVTNDEERAKKMGILRVHGMEPKYFHKFVGANLRFDALQAAVVRVKLNHLDSWSEARQKNAERFTKLFEKSALNIGDKNGVRSLPKIVQSRHIFNQYIIRVAKRDELRQFLIDNEIGVEIYYPLPLHMQECFQYLGHSKGDFPESEKASEETLALPVYPELSDEQAEYLVSKIIEFYSK